MFGDRRGNRAGMPNNLCEIRVGHFSGLLYVAARGDRLLLHGLCGAANRRKNELLIADTVENSRTLSDARLRIANESGLGSL